MNRRHRGWRRAALLASLLMAALLAGCSRSHMADLRHYVAQVKAHQSNHIKPLPKIQRYKPFTYPAKDRRDPFAPVPNKKQQHRGKGPRPNPNHVPGPLEQFPLSSLQMRGTLTANGRTYALIVSPDGIVHRVRKGDYLGEHYGRVTGITSDKVSVVELMPTGFGGYRKQSASIARGG